ILGRLVCLNPWKLDVFHRNLLREPDAVGRGVSIPVHLLACDSQNHWPTTAAANESRITTRNPCHVLSAGCTCVHQNYRFAPRGGLPPFASHPIRAGRP